MSVFQKKYPIEKKYIVVFFLSTSAILGMIRFIIFMIPRSKPDNQLILGLSAARVFVGSIFLILLLINIGVVLFTLVNLGPRQKEFEKKVIAFFSEHHVAILLLLYLGLAILGAFFLAIVPPVIRPFRFLLPIHARLAGFLSWIFAADLLLVISVWLVSDESVRSQRGRVQLDTVFVCISIF